MQATTFEAREYHVTQYLSSIKRKVDDIDHICAILDETRELARGLRSKGFSESVSGSSTHDRLAEALAGLERNEQRLAEAVEAHHRAISIAVDLCPPSNVPCRIAWLRVARGMRWREVADEVGYSPSQTRNLYKDGIDELYEKMPWIWQRKVPDAWVDEWDDGPRAVSKR